MEKPDVFLGADGESDRRSFLTACGKYSLLVPPTMTMLLSTTLTSPAIAKSGGQGGGGGSSGGGSGGSGGSSGGGGGGAGGSGGGAGGSAGGGGLARAEDICNTGESSTETLGDRTQLGAGQDAELRARTWKATCCSDPEPKVRRPFLARVQAKLGKTSGQVSNSACQRV
ncbi:hypothetical protein [Novosphingobium sp. ZW T3_23]|uniref:hypothetical protein n=1 Tax=Novosphingobium sp. ZW T3_23 TaxID=3378084 RepID=UPI0038524B46